MTSSRGLAALLALACALGCGQRSETPHDLILVVVDTLRADHLEAYGYERATAPTLARLASEGLLYERCFAPSSWTLPSMNMLHTGEARVENAGEIGSGQRTLAERLRAGGLRTGAVVSNPLLSGPSAASATRTAPPAGPPKGFERGFEHYELYEPRPGTGRIQGWPASEVTRRGLAWLGGLQASERAFLWLHYFDPHDPYEPEGGLRFEPWSSATRRAAFAAALPAEQRGLLDDAAYAGIEMRIALYDSEILQFDRALAQLVQGLELLGRYQDALLVITSDHGEGLWQRSKLPGEEDKPHAFFPELYFDHGVMLYQEQVHVPLVLRDPHALGARRLPEPVSLLDLMPTLLTRMGFEGEARDPRLDGLDLGAEARLASRRELVSLCSRSSSLLLDGKYKLHVPRQYRVERFGAHTELYALDSDPLELAPLQDPVLEADLHRRLEDWLRSEAQPLGPESARSVDDQLLERLGYVGEGSREQRDQ